MNRFAAAVGAVCAMLFADLAQACEPAPAGGNWILLLTVAGFADTYEWLPPRVMGPQWVPPFGLSDGTRIVPLAPDDEDLERGYASQLAEFDNDTLACLSAKYRTDRIAVVSSYQGTTSVGIWGPSGKHETKEFNAEEGVPALVGAFEDLLVQTTAAPATSNNDGLVELRLPDMTMADAETGLARVESIALLGAREAGSAGGVIVTIRDFGEPGTLDDRLTAAGVKSGLTGKEEPQEPEFPEGTDVRTEPRP